MSFLDDLRAEADQVQRNSTLTLAVPGSQFVVRFRPPPDRDALTGVIAAYRTGGALTGDQERQLLVDCCAEILRRTNDTDDLDSAVAVDPDGGPLRFDASDERWGGAKTARECVSKLFKLDQRPLAAAGAADVLIDWLQGLDDEVLRRVEGKSEGPADSSETPPAST